jgi:hypothetical protein
VAWQGVHAKRVHRQRGEQRGEHAPLVPPLGALLPKDAEAVARAVDHAQREPRARRVARHAHRVARHARRVVRHARGARGGGRGRRREAQDATAALGARVRHETCGDEVLEWDVERVLAEGRGEAELPLGGKQL